MVRRWARFLVADAGNRLCWLLLVLGHRLVGILPLGTLFFFFLEHQLVVNTLQCFCRSLLLRCWGLSLVFWFRGFRLRLWFNLVFLGCGLILSKLFLLRRWSWAWVFALWLLYVLTVRNHFSLVSNVDNSRQLFSHPLLFLLSMSAIADCVLYVVKFTYLSCVVCFCTLIVLKSLGISQSIDRVISWRGAWIDTGYHYNFWWLLV
jgi:hypothetical protein